MPIIKKTSKLKNTSGFSLIELVIALSIMGIVFMGTMSIILDLKKSQIRAEEIYSLNMLREEILTAFKDKSAWKETVKDSRNTSSLSCLRANPYNCSSKAGQTRIPIPILKSGLGHVIIDKTTSSTKGFDKFGQPCTGYGGSNPNCIYSVDISWTPTSCQRSSCFAPGILLKAHFHRNGDSGTGPLNIARYNIQYLRSAYHSADIETLKAMCASLGGTFNLQTNQCAGYEQDLLSQACTSLGGTFNLQTNRCNVPTPTPTPTPTPSGRQIMCMASGGVWDDSGNVGYCICPAPLETMRGRCRRVDR